MCSHGERDESSGQVQRSARWAPTSLQKVLRNGISTVLNVSLSTSVLYPSATAPSHFALLLIAFATSFLEISCHCRKRSGENTS